MSEHLARINLKNGKAIDIHRENKDIRLTDGDHSLVIHKGTGQQTLELLGLLESLGENIEFPEE